MKTNFYFIAVGTSLANKNILKHFYFYQLLAPQGSVKMNPAISVISQNKHNFEDWETDEI